MAKSIGLSRIQIQQEGLISVNDPKTRLVLGKDIGAGFSLIYSFVLSQPEEQTWIASYRYGRNISARFIDQDDSTYTASISHRIQFGRGFSQDSVFLESKIKERGPRISSIQIRNNSPLTEKEIQETLKTQVGEHYDYWDLQERAENLKQKLQNMGYLAPSLEVREQVEKGIVVLTLDLTAGDPAEMIFDGTTVPKESLRKYRNWWSQGISSTVVLQLIQDDLLQQHRLNGYYKASVRVHQEKSNGKTLYVFQLTAGPRFASAELKFQGAEQYDPKILQKDLSNLYRSPSKMFVDAIYDFSSFEDQLEALYAQRGLLRTEVSPGPLSLQTEASKAVRQIIIREGPVSQVASVTVSEGQMFPDSLQKQLLLSKGKTFRPESLLDDELKIRGFYESEGYPEASVLYKVEFQESSDDLMIQWSLATGQQAKIASIQILGNETTRADLIRKQTGLKEGDVLTQYNRSLARKRLSDLGVFHQVSLETEETDQPGLYDVVVRVAENKKYEFQYGVRYNTEDHLGGEIRLTDFNFLGRAQNLSLYTQSSFDLPLFRIDYTLPVTESFWDRTRFSFFRDRRDDDVEATVSGEIRRLPFEVKQVLFQFQQDRRMWNYYRLIWGFEYGPNSATFSDPQTSQPATAEGTISLFQGAFLADRRDDPLNAQRGYFYSIDGEFAPTILGSDISYAKNYSQFFFFRNFHRVVFATGLRAGFLKQRSNVLTVSEKFRTGGSTTLRGFGLNTVVPGDDPVSIFFGGNSVFILNLEMRYPIYKWLSGAVFYDGGNVYLTASDFNPSDLRNSVGFGFRAGASGFLVRFDLGFNVDPQEEEPHTVFHFGIGQAF